MSSGLASDGHRGIVGVVIQGFYEFRPVVGPSPQCTTCWRVLRRGCVYYDGRLGDGKSVGGDARIADNGGVAGVGGV